MKNVTLLFSNKFMTEFMQNADMFEPFKVVIEEPLHATVVDDWGKSHIAAIKRHCKKDNYELVAAVGDEKVYYSNPKVKVVSNGQGWMMLEEYLEHLINLDLLSRGKQWSVGL